MPDKKPKLAITMGDPAGIGPEIIARICHDEEVRAHSELVIIGRQMVLAAGALACNLPFPQVEIIETGNPALIKPGQPSASSGAQAISFIEKAVQLCLANEVQAMVTAPISKEHIQLAGAKETGHTDMLGRLTNTPNPVMMMIGKHIRVALVTVHAPLREVAQLITQERILHTILETYNWFKAFSTISQPRLAVAALNPHAGENGYLGEEEKNIIAPVIDKLKQEGMNITGPLAADSLFWRVFKNKEFDAVVCMYHDQGLIPFKIAHFEDGVNVTLGLPIIRTSPDHGTAFDLAGKGVANSSSMKIATLLAARLALTRL